MNAFADAFEKAMIDNGYNFEMGLPREDDIADGNGEYVTWLTPVNRQFSVIGVCVHSSGKLENIGATRRYDERGEHVDVDYDDMLCEVFPEQGKVLTLEEIPSIVAKYAYFAGPYSTTCGELTA